MPEPKQPETLIDAKGLRIDGRRLDQLRPLRLEVGLLDKADGSAYIEHGKNKILVAVYGPREAHPKHIAMPERAVIRCRYHMAPFSVDERKNPAPSRREMELSKVIRESLEHVVMTDLYPRTTIDVFIEVLQSDGGSRCAGITAASLALADAGIPMRELVAACAVGKIQGKMALDLSDAEDKYGDADLPVAYVPNAGLVTLLQMDGNLTTAEFEQGLSMAIEACKTIHTMQREVLKKKFATVKEATEEREEREIVA